MKYLLFLCLLWSASPYAKKYGTNYQKALNFLEKHQTLLDQTAASLNIETAELNAVVFPELLRYNQLQDILETKALEQAYLRGLAVDFSIGPFQMKPSFAQTLEDRLDLEIDRSPQARLARLKTLEGQVFYLHCFLMLCQKEKLPTRWNKVELWSCKYNSGLDKTIEELAYWRQQKAFPYGPKVSPDNQDNYTDIALDYYAQFGPK
ncbi:hypothetical protein PPO43_01690 [Saprospira sp. CCB-QB6]|uniref:hypothetical protein n=1 Tax=Saprospira sp. CCB-QB6 TaxID=3023936 RepID=UPI00234A2B3E|nr:hypothetical protein [Saprospira sp. CCB-QB6]WCL81808.1 hypothetical protein PPO43_01690 [Saprospira sp. CCB-QB6]